MDKCNYINEGYLQLSNSKHYKKISEPVHPKVTSKINKILNKIKQDKYLKAP